MKKLVIQIILVIVSVFAFALLTGSFLGATTIVIALYIHELGHALAMRIKKIPSQGIFFIPFLGAVTHGNLEESKISDELFVAIAGPCVNIVLSFILLGTMTQFGHKLIQFVGKGPLEFIFAFSGISLALGLLNLLPFFPLDGGHIIRGIIYSLKEKYSMVFCGLSIIPLLIWMIYFKAYLIAPLIIITFSYVFFGNKLGIQMIKKEKMNIYRALTYLTAYLLLLIGPSVFLVRYFKIPF